MRRIRSWRLRQQTVLGAAEAEIVVLAQILAERTDERDKARTAVAELTDALGREIARRVDAEAVLAVKCSELADARAARLKLIRLLGQRGPESKREAELRRADVERTGGR